MTDEVIREEEFEEEDEAAEPPRRPPAPAAAIPAPAARQPFRPYKPGQGVHVRWGSAIGAGVIVIAGAMFMREWLRVPFGESLTAQTLIPVATIVAAAYLVFWLVGKHHGVVDFMIATEGEMKKVNWSSRKEILGATKVVIFAVLALGFLLFLVDFAFILLFASLNVLKIPIWQSWLGAASGAG